MSTLNVANIQSLSAGDIPVIKDSSGTEVARLVKAFCRFNMTNGNITSSFNVSTITDHGVGDYSVTYTNAFGSGAYAYTIGGSAPVNTHHCHASTYQHTPTTTSIRLGVFRDETSTSRADDSRLCVVIF
tara:strand:- start:466 stop:852 length:387 start_codon:yes stop_codon:yes gene_type:complete